MSKRWAVTCSSCKFYNFPVYSIETSDFHNKGNQLKKPNTCICSKENEKGTNDVDSLRGLRSKSDGSDLDDKIKNLKSELTSLVKEDSKPETQNNNNKNNNNNSNVRCGIPSSVIKCMHKNYGGNASHSRGEVNVNPHHVMHKQTKPGTQSNSPQKKEFTNWLSSTIDSLSGTSNSDSNISKQIPTGSNRVLVDGNADYLNQDWEDLEIAQELLYESFLVQNCPCYMTPANDEGKAVPLNVTKRKHEAKECRNSLAKRTRTHNSDLREQENNNSQTNRNSSDSDVEVINIDDDSNNSCLEIKEVDSNEDTEKVIVIEDNDIEDNDITPETKITKKENSDPKKTPWECPICLEQNTGQEVVTTMCGHVFCKKCLEGYNVKHKTCPTCRANLQDKPLITLFNF